MIKEHGRYEKFTPLRYGGGDKYTISWAYTPKDDKRGSWYTETLKGKPSMEAIQNCILDFYNDKVDQEILSGFTWNGMQVWLSSENQFNYKAAFDAAVQSQGANLPIKFKFGTNIKPIYHTFYDLNEFSDFYMKAIAHIQKTLEKGWEEKDKINWEIYNF